MSNRIGHFNPSLQGPNEPAYSLERQLEQYIDELGFIKGDIVNAEHAIDKDKEEILKRIKHIRERRKHLGNLQGSLAETAEYVKDLEEHVISLTKRKDQILLELELLREDPGNEKEIETLQDEYLEINSRL